MSAVLHPPYKTGKRISLQLFQSGFPLYMDSCTGEEYSISNKDRILTMQNAHSFSTVTPRTCSI
ncbi:hypothetical protein DPF_2644 [Desulfoplanes formicivorans]|uniref:Uncharacterized protein n=1 Tax=Desulfoplanes formicivorans TaxID=1592317 RepID=A0A194AKR7_9BACT|nr:hypothetical protein DPF_2644 [Desulfoplanes formicivorans]